LIEADNVCFQCPNIVILGTRKADIIEVGTFRLNVCNKSILELLANVNLSSISIHSC
jgi:hypothetical protein